MGAGIGQRTERVIAAWQWLLHRLPVQAFRKRQARWLARRVPPGNKLRLSQRIIFILPTMRGVMFGFGAIIVMIIAVAERNLVALLLGTLFLSLFLLSLILCYRNLSGLLLSAADLQLFPPRQRVFKGDVADFRIALTAADGRRSHQDLWLGFGDDSMMRLSIGAGASTTITLSTQAAQRGVLSAPRLMLRTQYPVGLWRAWSRPDLAMRVLVYPQPFTCTLPAIASRTVSRQPGEQQASCRSGMDDFLGLRSYQAGDSRRHIAWQAMAKGQGLRTKQFVSEGDQTISLRWSMFQGHDPETILAFLSYQVLHLSRRQHSIELRLPANVKVAAGQGEAHKHQLLQALALWEPPV